jgi:hypothetical protein
VITTISVVSRIFSLEVFGIILVVMLIAPCHVLAIYYILGQCAATSPRTQAYRRTSTPPNWRGN